MKILSRISSLIILVLILISCSRGGEEGGDSEMGYVKITLDGNNYSQDFANLAGTGGGIGGLFKACSGKPISSQYLSHLENSSFWISLNLTHLKNEIDFGTPSPSNYNIFSPGGLDIFTYKYCYSNPTLELVLYDKSTSKDCILQSGTHKIISITPISSASDKLSTCYAVQGEFSAKFKYPNGTIKNLTGTYKTFIQVLK